MVSLEKEKFDLFELLLKHNANPLIGLNSSGENCLHILAQQCYKGTASDALIKILDGMVRQKKFFSGSGILCIGICGNMGDEVESFYWLGFFYSCFSKRYS